MDWKATARREAGIRSGADAQKSASGWSPIALPMKCPWVRPTGIRVVPRRPASVPRRVSDGTRAGFLFCRRRERDMATTVTDLKALADTAVREIAAAADDAALDAARVRYLS